MAISISNDPAQLKDLNLVFKNILTVAASLAGLAALIMILTSGFKYLTAGGDPKAAEQAKHTFTWAVLGLAALVAAWFILRFIFALTFTTGYIPFFDICITPNCGGRVPPAHPGR